MSNMRKPAHLLLLAPPVLALLLLLAGSIFPVRLDYRTLQYLTKFEGLEEKLSGARHIIYLSGDNGSAAGQTAAFTLRHLAFPDTTRTWLILAENRSGEWWGEWVAVDDTGGFSSPGRTPPTLVPARIPHELTRSDARIVCDSAEVLAKFQSRIPALARHDNIVLLNDLHEKQGSLVSAPRWEVSAARLLRLSLLIGAVLSFALLAASRTGDLLMGVSLGLMAGVATQIWIASISWQAWPIWLGVQWAAGWYLLRQASLPPVPLITVSSLAISAGLAISLVAFVARLDFDGDVITHWLPMARSFFHLGFHEPATLLAQGSMHAATYPPGYGIFLSIAMWVVSMDSGRPFLPGPDASLAILYYRLAIWLLNIGFLALLASCTIREIPRGSWLWLVALALVATLFPTVRASHVGAETLLFPLLGSALVLLVMGTGRLPLVGCAIAGIATLIKWEAAILVAAVFAPWFLVRMAQNPGMRSPGFLAMAAGLGLAALCPAIIWKSSLQIDNQFFQPASLREVWIHRTEWVSLLVSSLIFVLRSPLWIPLFLLLPVGWILTNARGFAWHNLMIPASTVLIFLAFVSMYLFSNWTTKTLHIEQSLDRLLYIPSLSCLLYFLQSLVSRDLPVTMSRDRTP